MRARQWGTAFCAVLAGCGPDGSSPAGGWESVRDTVGDTVVVRTVAGSVWGDTARLVEELRIGTLDGSEVYVLGDPVSLALGEGGVYVLDAQVPVVRAYDAGTGEYLRDIGREGGGPGEYGAPDAVAVLPDGRVLVRDPRNIRINVYASNGEFLEAWPHPNGGGFQTYDRMWVDTSGTAWVTTLQDWTVPPWEWEKAVIGIADGTITDTIREPDLAWNRADLTASREGSSSRRQVPFTGDRVWDFTRTGHFIAGITSRYAVYAFPADGPVLRMERETEPVPVLPEEAEERRARITAGLQRQYGAWRWNGPEIPDTKPPFRSMFADEAGRVWVVVSRPGEAVLTRAEADAEAARTGRPALRYREPPAFDVFDADGRYLGHVAAPSAMVWEEPKPLVVGRTVWAIERDDLGIPAVVRYRIER